ncbi:MAG: tRNA (guanosine(46)-N7)-methyltransferase TrmB [Erysipelotrichaceae bacterium]|nr:tRNA (guanosine(46)-N7)-methyltransferase TrmB [Erysipelotrichaceae bacterium]
MRLRYKRWARPYIEAQKNVYIDSKELKGEVFANIIARDNVYLEIGGGRGDFIVEMATNNEDFTFVMVEKNLNAAAMAIRKIVDADLKNVYVIIKDFFRIKEHFPNESIKGIFLNFSDPWPKTRHAKRRLTHENALKEYRRILIPSGKIAFKTDNVNFYTYSIGRFREYNWDIDFNSYNYSGKDDFDAQSEYEKNFRYQRIPICRLIASKGENVYDTE